ncbi:MAG: acetolactate synthase small subunit [Muribaculaceae bacterium]|jgi:acetolactate synthase-1/3 small subunit|nr:acetolactate synthase small subunit [Muribaculaceae bacterium]
MENNNTLFTIAVFAENHVGLLNQLSIIFTRRCLNIESVSASQCSIPGVHKTTMTCYSDRATMEKVIKIIEKRIDVLKAFLYTDDEIVYQEVALYKVPTARLLDEENLEEIIRRHNARILEISRDNTIIEKTGHFDETQALFEELKHYDIRQFVRSGRVAITKSPQELVDKFLAEQEDRRRRIEN